LREQTVSVQQDAFKGFANPVDPTPGELRAWAYHPDESVLKTMPQDWDLLVSGDRLITTLFDLAMDPACPARRFALHCLYIYAATPGQPPVVPAPFPCGEISRPRATSNRIPADGVGPPWSPAAAHAATERPLGSATSPHVRGWQTPHRPAQDCRRGRQTTRAVSTTLVGTRSRRGRPAASTSARRARVCASSSSSSATRCWRSATSCSSPMIRLMPARLTPSSWLRRWTSRRSWTSRS